MSLDLTRVLEESRGINYRPLLTEVSGLAMIVSSVVLIAGSVAWQISEPDEKSLENEIAREIVHISVNNAFTGLTRLALPIGGTCLYFIYQGLCKR